MGWEYLNDIFLDGYVLDDQKGFYFLNQIQKDDPGVVSTTVYEQDPHMITKSDKICWCYNGLVIKEPIYNVYYNFPYQLFNEYGTRAISDYKETN